MAEYFEKAYNFNYFQQKYNIADQKKILALSKSLGTMEALTFNPISGFLKVLALHHKCN